MGDPAKQIVSADDVPPEVRAQFEVVSADQVPPEVRAQLDGVAPKPNDTGFDPAAYGEGLLAHASQGFADEMQGAGAKLAHSDFGKFLASYVPGAGPGGGGDIQRTTDRRIDAPADPNATDYTVERNARQQAQDDAWKRSPWSYGLGGAAGVGLTALAPVPGLKGAVNAGKIAAGVTGVKALARVVPAAAAGFIGGGINAAGASRADTAAGVAEDTAKGAGLGLVTGPIVGEAAHGLAQVPRLLRSALPKAGQAVANGAAGDLGLQLGDSGLAARASKLADPVAGAPAREAAALGSSPERIAATADQLTGHVSDIAKAADSITWHEDVSAKRPVIQQMMRQDGADPASSIAAADKTFAEIRSKFDQLVSDVGEGPGSATLRKLKREAFDHFEKSAERTGAKSYDAFEGSGDAASAGADYATEKFMALDNLKRRVQKVIAKPNAATSEYVDTLREEVESPLRAMLEDSNVWGAGPAKFQQIRNQGWTDSLRLQKGQGGEFPFITEIGGQASADPFRVLKHGDRKAIQSIVEGAGDPANAQQVQQLVDWSHAEASKLEALTHHRDAGDDLVQAAQMARQRADQITKAVAQRQSEAGASRDFSRLTDVKPAPDSMARKVAQAIPGIGNAVKALPSPPSPAVAAQELQSAEQLLRSNPSEAERAAANAVIQKHTRIQSVTNPTPPTAPRAPSPARQVPGMQSVELPAHIRDASSATRSNAAPLMASARQSDNATDDPVHGSMLAAHKTGRDRDIAYSMLQLNDPAFKERERQRATKADEQEEQTQ